MKIKLIIIILISSFFTSCAYNKNETPAPIEVIDSTQSVTYTSYAKKVMDNECVVCHSVGGVPVAQTPFLTTYNEVKAQAINGRIQARLIDEIPSVMPTAGTLPQTTKDTIQMWLNQGSLE